MQDLEQKQFPFDDESALGMLLLCFFNYYAEFDFEGHGICARHPERPAEKNLFYELMAVSLVDY